MRCLTLASELNAHGWRCSFACTDETVSFMPALSQSGHGVVSADDMIDNVDVLIVDHYGLDRVYEEKCRVWAKQIVVIDDLADRLHDCDVLIDQTYGRLADDYKSLVPSHCRVLTGPSYALLRPQFVQARPAALTRRQEQAGKIDRILIMMGASDPDDVTSLALAGVNLVQDPLSIDIVMGASAPHLSAVQQKIQHSHHDIRLHAGVDEIAPLMAAADICLGAGGTTSWERCCLGLPSLVVEIADNQQKIIRELSDAGAIYACGHFSDLTPDKIYAILRAFLDEPNKLAAMTAAALDICDGWGAKRFVPWLYPALETQSGARVHVRSMEIADEKMVLEWQSFPGTRKYARNPAVPNEIEHHQWMVNNINSIEHESYIIELNNIPAGLLRLDYKEEGLYEVSILTAPDYYRQGIAESGLAWAHILKPSATLMAEVLDPNTASKNLFLKSGYKVKTSNIYVYEDGSS